MQVVLVLVLVCEEPVNEAGVSTLRAGCTESEGEVSHSCRGAVALPTKNGWGVHENIDKNE